MWLIIALYGGIISRLHGIDVIPRALVNIAWAAPLAYISSDNLWIMAVVFGLCIAGKSLAHGNWISLGNVPPGKSERTEFLIKWLRPYLSTRAYCVLGLSLVGLLAVLPAALALGSVWLAVAGLMKGPSYLVGHLVYPNEMVGKGPPYLKSATNWGEFLTGFVAYLALGVYLYVKTQV